MQQRLSRHQFENLEKWLGFHFYLDFLLHQQSILCDYFIIQQIKRTLFANENFISSQSRPVARRVRGQAEPAQEFFQPVQLDRRHLKNLNAE